MKTLYRHAIVVSFAIAVSLPFWLARLQWDPEMRLWRAIGDGSVVLLAFALLLGPAARHWHSVSRLLSWRRELGIWFAVLAIFHTVLVLDGWVRWDWMRFFGYEFIAQFGRFARMEPGFGLSNLIGFAAVVITFVLMVTSSDRAVKFLGGSSWKWLHNGAYTVFYLVVFHTLYFLFVHYTVSFHRRIPDDLNFFRYPFLAMSLLLLGVQMTAFAVSVRRRKAAKRDPER